MSRNAVSGEHLSFETQAPKEGPSAWRTETPTRHMAQDLCKTPHAGQRNDAVTRRPHNQKPIDYLQIETNSSPAQIRLEDKSLQNPHDSGDAHACADNDTPYKDLS
ncbi:hypothetical protein [Verminephrobacter aporrectodeae]|uniref:hypothetical protein n=1 Tax=Verminephrobacter aporrectodeae TaxID=1110389 RepID=UPI0022431F6A|nr:hypothetical protein [Verminephrobacter aporrectodeae]